MNLLMLSSCHVHVCMCMRIYLRHFLCPSSVCFEFMPRQLHRSGCFDPEAAPYIACILYIYLRNQQQHSNCESPLEVVWHCGFAVQPTLIYSIIQHSPYITLGDCRSQAKLSRRARISRSVAVLARTTLRLPSSTLHVRKGVWVRWKPQWGLEDAEYAEKSLKMHSHADSALRHFVARP